MCLQYKYYENTVGKGEIARNERVKKLPVNTLYVHKAESLPSYKGFKLGLHDKASSLYQTIPGFHSLEKEACLKHYGKKRNAGKQHNLFLFSTISIMDVII